MPKPTVLEHDTITGEVTEREMTKKEIDQRLADAEAQAAAQTAEQAARQKAFDKLAALGLTIEDLSALGLSL